MTPDFKALHDVEQLSKLIEDFEYQKDRLPVWVVDLIYRLRNSEADIGMKLGTEIASLQRELEAAEKALADIAQQSASATSSKHAAEALMRIRTIKKDTQ